MILTSLLFIAAVTTFESQIESDLKSLVEINSGSQNTEGLDRTARWIQKYFKNSNIALEWNTSEKYLKTEISAKGSKATILFVGHFDTVFEKDHPFQKQLALPESHRFAPVIQGPGVVDAKSGIILIHRLLINSNLIQNFNIKIFLAGDEELGSKVSRTALAQFAKGVDLAFVMEPGWIDGDQLKIPTSVGGSLLVHLSLSGPEGHIATSKTGGVGTADHLMKLIQDTGSLRSAETSMNVFDFHTETKSNVIAGKSSAKLAFRHQDPDLERILISRFEKTRTKLSKDFQLEFEIKQGWAPTKLLGSKQIALAQQAAKNLRQIIPQTEQAMARGAGTFLVNEGILAYESMGPLGEKFHSDQERLYLGSFKDRMKLILEIVKLHFNFDQIELELMDPQAQKKEL